MRGLVIGIFTIVGILLAVFANIVAIGNFLYDWGKLDLEMGLSAWNAFVIWLKMIGGALVCLIIVKAID